MMTDVTNQTRFRIQGMDCAGCASKIDTAVRRQPGVADVRVSVGAGTMTVDHAGGIDLSGLQSVVTKLGYKIAPATPQGGGALPAGAGANGAHDHAHGGHPHAEADSDESASRTAGTHDHLHDHAPSDGPWWRSPKGLLAIASGLALLAAYALGKLVPQTEFWAFTAAILVGLVPIARRAAAAAVAGVPFTIESLMTIAAVGAVVIGASEEAATVVLLFVIGELLEGVAAGKARASIQALTKLVPATALVELDGRTEEVAAEAVEVDQIVLVRPGDRIAADGVIVSGESTINEAAVTGESTPVRKGASANVFAGTVNGDAALRIRVTAAAADNTIARVVKLVEEAQESKAPTERFIDRFSRWYTPGVVAVAALVAIVPPLAAGGSWREWVYKGLAILLIGCPCALVISTPAAVAAALSAGARRGLLMKGGSVLEQLGKITAACFDKTGTLTAGKPAVTDIVPFERTETDVLKLAAAVETGSSHPLAQAVLARAEANGVQPSLPQDAQAHGGKGVSATVNGRTVFFGSPAAADERVALSPEQWVRIEALNTEGKSVSVVIDGDRIAGAIAMRDEPRPDAADGLAALREAGVRTVMLTGDNRRTADAIGSALGLSDVRAELLPQDKQRIVNDLRAQGFVVAKVGDGINDAPALAAADVGIAMGGGTDVALETADAAVLHGRVGDIARMIDLSKRTMRNIHQNIAIALGLKAVFLVTTVAGITGLWPAILADTGATVLVTANAMRLLRLPVRSAGHAREGEG